MCSAQEAVSACTALRPPIATLHARPAHPTRSACPSRHLRTPLTRRVCTHAPQVVNPVAVPVLCALCLPYAIRFVQCLLVNRATGARSQLANAAKYATAFPALVLTALEHEHHVAGKAYPLYGEA
jgi:hypothetical protein